MPRYSQPYRGDGRSSVPRRVPLNKNQQSSVNKFGAVALGVSALLIFLAFSTQNGTITLLAVAVPTFLLFFYFAYRDAMGIKTNRPDDTKTNKKGPAMLDDYLAQIEWKRTHLPNHPKEPTWQFRPRPAKIDIAKLAELRQWVFILLLFTCLPVLLVYFFNINSIFTTIGAFILGLAGFLTYLIHQDSSL